MTLNPELPFSLRRTLSAQDAQRGAAANFEVIRKTYGLGPTAAGSIMTADSSLTSFELVAGSDQKVLSASSASTGGLDWGYPQEASQALILAAGGDIYAQSIPWQLLTTGVGALTSQRLFFVPVVLSASRTITGVTWEQTTQGDYTASAENKIALYASDGTTLTRVAQSANTGTLWKASAGLSRQGFTAPYAASEGLLYVALLHSRSATVAAPQIRLSPTYPSAFATASWGSSNFVGGGYVDSIAAMPTTQAISGLTFFNQTWWVGLF